MPLILDGGNFINNSSIVFLTNKVIKDNPEIKVLEMLSDYCGLSPIIINTNCHDSIAHTDGYMAFNNEQSIFLSQYPHKRSTISDVEYTQHLIYAAVTQDLEVIPIYDLPSIKKGHCGCNKPAPCFYSAEGTYINFLRLNDTIILPEYSNCKSQGKDLNVLNENILRGCGLKVLRINCDLLGSFGGSLHCISWQA